MKTSLKLICFCAAFLLTGQPAQAANKLTKITGNIYAYMGTEDYSPDNSFGANSGVVIGQNAVLVVDTQISSKRAQALIAEIKKVTDKPIRYVLNTHWHVDHSFGNADFQAQGATVISHVQANAKMKVWSEKILAKGWSKVSKEEARGTKVVYPEVLFTKNMQIDLGGVTVDLVYFAHSHTVGSVYAYVADEKVLFAGDMLFNDYYANMSGADVDGWVKTINHVSTLDLATVVPGHGALSGKKELTQMRSYIELFDKKAKEYASSTDDIAEVMKKMIKVLPPHTHGESSIHSSLKWKYMKKKKQ